MGLFTGSWTHGRKDLVKKKMDTGHLSEPYGQTLSVRACNWGMVYM